MSARRETLRVIASLVLAGALAASAAASDDAAAPVEPAAPTPVQREDGLEPLVPEIDAAPLGVDPGERQFLHRLAVSPAFGWLGSERLFAMRFAYNPNPWLGYEWSIGHNPGQSVHAAVHMVNAQLRRPMSGRLQPYLSLGYGMILVFPGESLNADPVTKNALAAGGGLEFYVRNDLALRAELRNATVIGSQRDHEGIVAYHYLQSTIGLSFYRSIRP